MESKLIYIVSERLKSKITWPDDKQAGWRYCGTEEEVNLDFVQKVMDGHFQGDSLYVCLTRQQGYQASQQEVLHDIKSLFGHERFLLWNTSFTRVIECNKIGVLRCGVVNAEPGPDFIPDKQFR